MNLSQLIRKFFGNLFGAFKPLDPTPDKVDGVVDTSIIRKFEGLRLDAYRDPVGIWTIGYGHTKTAHKGMKITGDYAEKLLRQDLDWVERAINRRVKVPLEQHQYDALASFIYNVGETAFGKSTLLKKLNQKDYRGAADELLRWNKAGGKVLRGLTRRREAERKYFLHAEH